jgi:sugar/nucleoside kinase (ribokinase family)
MSDNLKKYEETVDPTGAGDAWRGGFIAGILESKPVFESLLQANALASFAVEKYGTVNHKPTVKKIEERMKIIRNYMSS